MSRKHKAGPGRIGDFSAWDPRAYKAGNDLATEAKDAKAKLVATVVAVARNKTSLRDKLSRATKALPLLGK